MDRLKRLGYGLAAIFLAFAYTTLPVIGAPNPIAKTLVQGAQASGSTNSQYPVVVGGTTSGGVNTIIRTDSNGAISLGASTGTSAVEGEVAEGASAASTNPVVIAGLSANGSGNARSPRVSTNGATGNSISTGLAVNSQTHVYNGATFDFALAANTADGTTGTGLAGAGLMVFDGTNWQQQAGDSTGTVRTGSWRTAIKSTPTVGTGTAYAAGDVIGAKNTLSNAVRISGGNGVIRSVTVSNKSGVADPAIALRVWYFDSDPSGSTFTDNAALTIVDADITKCIGFIDLPGTGATATSNEVWFNKSSDLHFVASGSTSIYMVLESRGAVAANAGTTDWQITTVIEQD